MPNHIHNKFDLVNERNIFVARSKGIHIKIIKHKSVKKITKGIIIMNKKVTKTYLSIYILVYTEHLALIS